MTFSGAKFMINYLQFQIRICLSPSTMTKSVFKIGTDVNL